MQIWRTPDDVPADLGRTVVTVGNFDGVHLGHRRVVARAREAADAHGISVIAVTFDPHPMAVLRPEHAPTTLTSIEDRAALLGEAGVDAVLALPFTREVAGWSPKSSSTASWSTCCTPRPWSSAPTSASATGPPATWRR